MPRTGTSWRLVSLVVGGLLLFVGCKGDHAGGNGGVPDSWEDVCIDEDRDGHGVGCEQGADCDDNDREVFEGCAKCKTPNTGCACEEGAPPQSCVVSREFQETGSLLCKTGTRYCRDGAWTDCIGVRSYEVPAPEHVFSRLGAAVIDQDAAPKICDACRPDCYKVEDYLTTITDDPNTTTAPGGGLTLADQSGNAPNDPDALDPNPPCMPGVINPQFGALDDDCDGIPDNYDKNPNAPPFQTNHTTITMGLAPGQEGSRTFELQFVLNTVDVYFLLDTTASMDGELNRLITDLTTGNFLDDPSTPANESTTTVCASPLGSSTTDPTLKTKGIAGNIACLVPNSGFGAGFFREIPFDNPDSFGLKHAYDWFIPYEHRQDISTSVQDTLSALKLFYTAGNVSWPEDDIFALEAVATGGQIYTGWDRPGIEARTCPDPTKQYGWPCFRREAIPVIILITDASMMNGPDVDVYKNNTSSCYTNSTPFTTTSTACTSDASCEAVAAYAGKGYFCSQGRCVVQNAISAACQGGDGPDGRNDGTYNQALNYAAMQTNTMAVTPDRTYHRVDGNESYTTAYSVGDISNTLITYVGDTRGMTADIHAGNLGTTCSQWPTSGSSAATSATTPGYPDAVFQFHVSDATKPVTISTAGSNHAPTLAIVSTGAAAAGTAGVTSTTSVTAPASSDTTPWSFGSPAGAFDTSVGVDLTGFSGTWPRSAFGTCMDGSPGATDLAPDAVFAFTPQSNLSSVSFTTGASTIVPTDDTTANKTSGFIVNLGAVLGQRLEYYGTTASTTPDKWTSAQLGTASCRSTTTAANNEHVFKFTLATAAQLELRLNAPASYDPVLSLFGPTGTAPASGSNVSTPNTCNHTVNGDDVITGNFAAGTYYVMVHAFSNATSAAGTYSLVVREVTDEAIALYDAAPTQPTNIQIMGPQGANSNDKFYDFGVGQIDGNYKVLNAGDTSSSYIHPDYLASSFQAATGNCSNVSGLANDSVIEFSVAQTRTVRIETFDGTGTDPNQSAGFDHVVAVVERPVTLTVSPTAVTNNDATASARLVNASDVPTAVGDYLQLTGATYANGNTVPMSPSVSPSAMYDVANPDSATCSTVSSSLQDVVYRFDVDAASEGVYDFDTFGSQSTTYLSLHRGAPDTLTSVSPVVTASTVATDNSTGSSSPSGAQTGVNLGAVDGKTITYSDTTDATTSNKWTDTQFAGCRLAGGNAAHEHVLSFSVTNPRTVSITLTASGSYDPSIALFTTAPVAQSLQTNLRACSRVSTTLAPAGAVNANPGGLTSVGSGSITGNLAAGTYYLMVYGYQNAGNMGSYTLSVSDVTTRQTRSVASNDGVAGGAQTANGVDLGDVSGGTTVYTGTTTTSTASKWTAVQAGTATGITNGCRQNNTQDNTHEQVLRFSVSGATRALRLELTRSAGTFDPVFSVLTGAPIVNSPLGTSFQGCVRAYTTATATPGGTLSLSVAGNSSTGGRITGTFAPGTYYVIVNGYATDSVGTYTLRVVDTSTVTATDYFGGQNTQDNLLNGSGGATSGPSPYVDFGTIGAAGASYHGMTSGNTVAKWNGNQLGGSQAANCRTNQSNANRAEHVFKLTLPASSSATVTLAETFSSTNVVLALFGPSTTVPTISSNIGSPANCSVSASGTGTLNVSNGSVSPATYWVMVYPESAPSAWSSYTGSYDLSVRLSGGSTATWAANSQDAALNASIVGAAPYLNLGTVSSTQGASYSGTTSTSTATKWTSAQLGSASGRTAGQAIDAVEEHLFRFDTTSSTALALDVSASFDVVLSVFGPSATVPQTHTTFANPLSSNNGTGTTASLSGNYNGTYWVLVHGAKTGERGTYTLTVRPNIAATQQSGGSFVNTYLNDSTSPAPYADFGTLGSTAYYYAGAISDSGFGTARTSRRWTGTNLATYNNSAGCTTSNNNNTRQHIFKFSLSSLTSVSVKLATSNSFDGSVNVYGPVNWDSSYPDTSTAINPGSLTNASCTHVGQNATGVVSGSYGAGDYLIVVAAWDRSNNDSGNYTLTVTPAPAVAAADTNNTALNASTPAAYADFGTLDSVTGYYAGSTASATAKWSNTQLGTNVQASCRSTSSTTSRDQVKEHLFRFALTQATRLELSVNATWKSVLSVFGPSSTVPSVSTPIASPFDPCNQTDGADDVISATFQPGTYWVVVHGNTNSESGSYALTIRPTAETWADNSQDGALDGTYAPFADFGTIGAQALFYKGTTSSNNTPLKWTGSQLATSGSSSGCRVLTTEQTPEHVFSFTLTSTKALNITLSPTTFDPVLSLFGPSTSIPNPGSNVGDAVACYHDAANTGSANNGTASLSGTYGPGTYYVVVHGYNWGNGQRPSGTYTLTIDPTTIRTVATDDTAAEATVASSTAVDLGTVDNYVTTYFGTTSAVGTPNKWTDAQVSSAASSGTGAATGCRASITQDSGREHLLKFTVASSRALTLNLAGALNGVLSVYQGALPTVGSPITTLLACSHNSTPASDATTGAFTAAGGTISGNFSAGTYYVLVHGYNTNNAGSYTLTVSDSSVSYATTVVAGNGGLAGGSGPQSGVTLGTVDSHLINYSGDTTSAINKWSQANISSAGNTGCRASGNDTGREHVLKFTVASPRRVAIRLAKQGASTYDPVLSIFNSGAPTAASAVSGLMACSHVSSGATTDNVAVTAGFTAAGGLITGTFAAGTYYVLVHGYGSTNNQGAYTLQLLDTTPENLGVVDVGQRVSMDGDTSSVGIPFNQWQGSDFPVANSVSNGGRLNGTERTNERLYAFTVTGAAKPLTVSVDATFDVVLSVFDTLPTAMPAGGGTLGGLLETSHNTGSYFRSISRTFNPGTYYVLVHGYRASAAPSGTYTLSVGDDNWQSNLVACDSRGTGSKLTAMNLTQGTYYLVVKSGVGTGLVPASYRYVLNIRHTFSQPFIACDYESFGAGSRRGYIETTLQGGKTYAVVVRGVTPSDIGTYGVIIRDVTAGTAPLGCANAAGYTSAANNPNSFTADLTAGRTYYVVVRSNSASSVGQANVRIANYTTSTCAFNNVTFDSVGTSAGVSPYVPAQITTRLPVGDYYAVVKGNQNLLQSSVKIPTGSTAGVPDDRGRGRYQITFGDPTLAVKNQQFNPPQWGTSSSGVYADLIARGIRVITVNSLPSAGGSADLYMREQSKVISAKTGALDRNGAPIRRNIGADGSGMGFAVVDAVAKFANAVQMDMSVRLTLSPDDPGIVPPNNRRFEFVSRAVPAPSGTSNGCGTPIDTNSDGILDTHTACGPGATPRFEIRITNPASPNNVPLNPDPNRLGGGYLMTLQLIGKDRLVSTAVPQIVDEIPVYIIPEDVFPHTDVVYPASATYSQTVNGAGCMGSEVPSWNALIWHDTLPAGTKLEWSVCGGNDTTELAACDSGGWVLAATTTPGGSCTSSADCSYGYCNAGTCEYNVGTSCVADSECGRQGACVMSQCRWTADPTTQGIPLTQAAAQFTGKSKLRVQVKLFSNASHSEAPTIQDFRLDYTCAQQE